MKNQNSQLPPGVKKMPGSNPVSVSAAPKKKAAVKPSGRRRSGSLSSAGATVAQAVMHASAKSGYAGVVPGTAADPGAVPPATASGRQIGVPTPAERKYGVAKYEAVDVNTAMARAMARQSGAMPVIRGGLDNVPASEAARPVTSPTQPVQDQDIQDDQDDRDDQDWANEDGDSFVERPPESDFAPKPNPRGQLFSTASDFSSAEILDVDPSEMDAFDPDPGPGVRPVPPRTNPPWHQVSLPLPLPRQELPKSEVEKYLAGRKPVVVELSDTEISLAAIDVVVGKYSITLLLPVVDGGGTFTLKPGSAVTVKTDDQAYECYFPGSSFALPGLKALGLSFIRAAEEP